MPYNSHPIALPGDVFSLALHPSKPLLAAGLSAGHLHAYTWDGEDGGGEFSIAWKTKRHRGSCRCIAFSGDGGVLYSSGTDSLFKAADSETGRVVAKILVPPTSSNKPDIATTILPLSPHHLLLGTDSGTVHLLDTRTPLLTTPTSSWPHVHDDYISSLTALPPGAASTTGFSRQFISTGATTLTHLDVRKPTAPLFTSDDQEDELLCSALVSGLSGRTAQQLIAGTASGVATLWNKGEWADHENRINISKASGDSIDALLVLPETFTVGGKWGRYVAAGAGDGKVRIVRMGSNHVVATLPHSWTAEEAKGREEMEGGYEGVIEEGVAALGIDCEGRVVSGGGSIVRVWHWEDEADEEVEGGRKRRKEGSGSDEDEDSEDEEDDDDSSEDEKEKRKKRKKKRKGGKGKAKSAGYKAVASFKGLD